LSERRTRHDYVTTDLSGGAVERVFPARSGGTGGDPRTVLAYDGRRIAYAQPHCRGDRVVVDRIASLASSGPPRIPPCPAER
jgi:hypothetical protein